MIEYSKDNKFPFFQGDKQGVAIQFDNHEDRWELDFIYDKIVQKFPSLKAEKFYSKVKQIEEMNVGDKKVHLKAGCDKLLKNISKCLSDEVFVHQLQDSYGLGVSKIIGTLYAVYGYYFYTGKRTANVIKKTLDGYKKRAIQ